ncbi:MAG: hypothetical protein ACTTHG_04960 [Treponemataceae bacterium]
MTIKKILLTTNFRILLAFMIISSFSCATTIEVRRQKPAQLDLNGASSISVLPFQTQELNSMQYVNILFFFEFLVTNTIPDTSQQLADYLSAQLQTRLLDSNEMTVIGSRRVEDALRSGIEVPVDAYITGSITEFSNEIEKNMENDGSKSIPVYKRKVSMNVSYQIIEAKTGKVMGYKYQSYKKESSPCKIEKELPSAFTLLKPSLDEIVNKIMRQIQPYYVTKYIKLLRDTSKNENMKIADQFAKDGYLLLSQNEFMKIYKDLELFEAGFNAGLLMQARGKLKEAESFMYELYNKTGNPRAQNALFDIQEEIKDEIKLKNQRGTRN